MLDTLWPASYQLEIGNRIETFHKLANMLVKEKLSLKEKEQIVEKLKCLKDISGWNGRFQNKCIVGMEVYMNWAVKEKGNIDRISNEIYILNNNKYLIRKEVLKNLKNRNIGLNYEDIELENMCKNFFGEKQYVVNEGFTKDIIKLFRIAYK